MNDLLYLNNIKERLFNHLSSEDFDSLLTNLLNIFNKSSTHFWYDIKYLNSCLELYFIYFSKIEKPLPLFYSFFLKNVKHKVDLSFLNLDFNTKNKLYYFKNCKEFILNDLNISENDFNIFQSICLFNDYIKIPLKEKAILCSGFSLDSDRGLSFKFKRTNR